MGITFNTSFGVMVNAGEFNPTDAGKFYYLRGSRKITAADIVNSAWLLYETWELFKYNENEEMTYIGDRAEYVAGVLNSLDYDLCVALYNASGGGADFWIIKNAESNDPAAYYLDMNYDGTLYGNDYAPYDPHYRFIINDNNDSKVQAILFKYTPYYGGLLTYSGNGKRWYYGYAQAGQPDVNDSWSSYKAANLTGYLPAYIGSSVGVNGVTANGSDVDHKEPYPRLVSWNNIEKMGEASASASDRDQ